MRPGAACYVNNPNETESALQGGWLHKGDVTIRGTDGVLRIVDRKKDMIVTGGFNVFAREVEDVLLSHPNIREAAVVGVPDPKWGEAVNAVVIVAPEQEGCGPSPEIDSSKAFSSRLSENRTRRHCENAIGLSCDCRLHSCPAEHNLGLPAPEMDANRDAGPVGRRCRYRRDVQAFGRDLDFFVRAVRATVDPNRPKINRSTRSSISSSEGAVADQLV